MKFIVQDFKAVSVDSAPKLTFQGADTPEQVYKFYREFVEADPGYEPEKEHVVVIALNTRLQVIGWHLVSIGGLAEATCHPREIFRPVIARCAHSFVLVHNHPSGDPSPSRADEAVTRRMKEAADLLKISLADHVIIGDPAPGRAAYYSFRESGVI